MKGPAPHVGIFHSLVVSATQLHMPHEVHFRGAAAIHSEEGNLSNVTGASEHVWNRGFECLNHPITTMRTLVTTAQPLPRVRASCNSKA
jgi:hypothetical protein